MVKKNVKKDVKEEIASAWDSPNESFNMYDCFEVLKTIILAKKSYHDDYVDWAIYAAKKIKAEHDA